MSNFFERLLTDRPDPSAPMAPELLAQFGDALTELGSTLKSTEARFTADWGKSAEATRARIAALPLPPEDRRKVESAELTKLREVVRARNSIADEFVHGARRDLAVAEASLRRQEEYLRSDPAAINRATLGSTERANFAANLRDAGPAERRAALDLCRATGNPHLAAALLAIESNLPRADRVIEDRDALARLCLPPQVVAERARVTELRGAIDEAHKRLESLTGQAPSPMDRIRRGLRAGGARDGRGRGVIGGIRMSER